MSRNIDRAATVRSLVPINRLPPENQETLLAAGDFLTVAPDAVVYIQGHEDDYIHYLIDGVIDFLRDEEIVRRLSSDTKAARRALDQPGRKRHTVRASSNSTIFRIPRAEFDAQLEEGHLLIGPRQLEVSEIATEKSSNWMIKMLQSDLFERLAAENIQQIFGRMERISAAANDTVIKQGDQGDFYYVIEKGYCEVSREIPGGKEIHLADLSPGDAFGEAALIAGDARTASVTMLSDGTLMRLAKADFDELIRLPLLRPIGFKMAISELEAGARWLDTRYPEDCAATPLRDSKNIPLNVLRLQASRLDRTVKYVVCGDDPTQCAVGVFLLLERGINSVYLDAPIAELIDEHPKVVVPPISETVSDERVLVFPGARQIHRTAPETNTPKEPTMDENRPEGMSLESTIEKIDRLYSQKEWEAEKAARVPVQDYAQTSTGQRLAELIDEINERRDSLPNSDTPVDPAELTGTGFSIDEVIDIAPGEQPAEPVPPSVLLVDTRAPLPVNHEEILDEEAVFPQSDSLSDIMQDFESRIRDYIDNSSRARTETIELKYQDKLKRLRKAAVVEIRKRQEESKRKYEQRYKKKEIQLRAYYKKLMALANKISEQKAQLQQAKKQFEEKLSAANAVYKQVEDMRKTLRQHIGDAPADADPDKRQSA